MPAASTTHLDLLGSFRLRGRTVDATRLPSMRQQQILAFLILHARESPVPRHRVGGALWPDSTDEQALTNLRRELHHLREIWPDAESAIAAGSRTLAWQGSPRLIVDVLAFDAAADRGLAGDLESLTEAARLYQGDLLPDCEGEWIDGDRERLRRRAVTVFTTLIARLEEQRDFSGAIDHAQTLLRMDPLDESAWCTLMRAHARRGDRATALHLYQQCAAVLKKELGVQPSAATRATYHEILDRDETVPPAAPPRAAAYPLVGRRAEWQVLLSAWQRAAGGHPHLAIVRGEAGIGKSRLIEELVDWAARNAVAAVTTRCYAGEGRLAYAPIAAWLRSGALRPPLQRLDATLASDVARIHPDLLAVRDDVAPPSRELESWQRLRFFEALSQAFRAAAPLLLVVDDLQWADGDTLDWLQYFLHSAGDVRCLIAGTVRIEEEQDNPPLQRLIAQLTRQNLLTAIPLGPLDRTATAQLAGAVTERPLDEHALARVFRETEGHPLFIVERGRMDDTGDPAQPAPVAPQVQQVVAARLALLSDEARAVAEVAAAVGRDFRFDILAQASDLEEDVLVRALDELWRRHIVRVQADERWDFSHDRIRETAYASIGPARRRLVHRRIAQGLELLFADRLDEVSAVIAMHLEGGGQPARAVGFLARAAVVATRVSATEEAIRCLTHALALLPSLPAGRDRDRQELALRADLSVALNSGRGYAAVEVEENLDRVLALLQADGSQIPASWLWVAFTLRFMLGDLARTRVIAEQTLALAEVDPACRCEAHHAMGGALLSTGDLAGAAYHFRLAIAAYDEGHPQRSALGSDLGVFARAWGSGALWLLGDEDGALTQAQAATALATELDDLYSQALAYAYEALVHQWRGDLPAVNQAADATIRLCDQYGFGYYGDWARALKGWAIGHERPAEGVAMIETAIDALDRHRAQARRPYYLSLLADTCVRAGQRERAQAIVGAAITLAAGRNERWWLPALYLQRADLGPAPEREARLHQALEEARAQESHALESRILHALGAPR